jgi:hypothetical protein
VIEAYFKGERNSQFVIILYILSSPIKSGSQNIDEKLLKVTPNKQFSAISWREQVTYLYESISKLPSLLTLPPQILCLKGPSLLN